MTILKLHITEQKAKVPTFILKSLSIVYHTLSNKHTSLAVQSAPIGIWQSEHTVMLSNTHISKQQKEDKTLQIIRKY